MIRNILRDAVQYRFDESISGKYDRRIHGQVDAADRTRSKRQVGSGIMRDLVPTEPSRHIKICKRRRRYHGPGLDLCDIAAVSKESIGPMSENIHLSYTSR